MPHLPKSLHLEYNLTKPLRTSYSIAGITFMASAMAAVFVGALLTKGLTQSTELQYLPHPDTPGYNCNSTLIYPGQLFGSMLLNTSFEYQAMSQFAYRGQNITNCTPTDLTFIDVVGPPLNYPRININQTASCFIPNPDTKGGVTVSFAVNQLLYWGYFDRVSSIEVGVLVGAIIYTRWDRLLLSHNTFNYLGDKPACTTGHL
ncbi:hypothetical protein DL93DRAFT_2086233 [Clavulina sp. PMI_390]|nr:hypothetical protein DL93DRAFT_2086233 [Clavulina sp. PMI_390]